MSSLKAGAMLSLFSGYSLEDAMRAAAPQRESASYDHYEAPAKPSSAAIDLNLSSVRAHGAAVGRLFDQATQLMPNVMRSAFCGR